jgi:hypothetical protein
MSVFGCESLRMLWSLIIILRRVANRLVEKYWAPHTRVLRVRV